VAFEKLAALGFVGSERTARRAVAEVKANYRRGRRRVYRPWLPEPGMWAQWDWGTGPTVGGRSTLLFCAWLAWSRHRVVIPTWDRTMPTLISCLDRAMRVWGGVPTYWLTDNERTVTVDHVAGVAVRHPQIVAVGGHYGVTVATCVPADPESKGGVEATVRVAKADLVPTEANLRGEYATFAELAQACRDFMVEVNERPHRSTRRAPNDLLAEERSRLHRLPEVAYTAVFGETRRVSWSATISYGGVTYSVPHTLADDTVWARVDGDEIVVTHLSAGGAAEVARHRRSTPGRPMIDDAHYPPRPPGPLGRQPKAANPGEEAFLALGEGARLWLVEAATAGASRVRVKMAEAVELARLHGAERIDWALGQAATFGRFGEGDMASILAARPPGERRTAGAEHSLQEGTRAWEGFGR
jgi:transposase